MTGSEDGGSAVNLDKDRDETWDDTGDESGGEWEREAHDGPVRELSWACDGTAELELTVDVGRVRVELVPAARAQDAAPAEQAAESGPSNEVRVRVRHDPSAGGGWAQGIGGLLSWLGSGTAGFGGGPDLAEMAARAVRTAEVTWSPSARRLVVRPSGELPLRVVPLAVTVSAPAGSRLAARAASGDVTVTGSAGWAAVRTGTGRITTDAVDGDADVTTGSGDIELGPVAGRAKVRTASGTVRAAALNGPSEVRAGSGDVLLVEVAADVGVRTGSGAVTVSDARSGRIDLTSGAGDLRIGVHEGVRAKLDLSSGAGRALSDLDVSTVAPEDAASLVLTGRTGNGDVLVTRGPA